MYLSIFRVLRGKRRPKSKRPHLSAMAQPDRFPHSRRHIFRHLIREIDGKSNCKVLYRRVARGLTFHVRDRGEGSNYFDIRLSGDTLVAVHRRFIYDGEPGNHFLSTLMGKSADREEQAVIVEMPYRRWQAFLAQFKERSPALGWRA